MRHRWLGSSMLLLIVLGTAGALTVWKLASDQASAAETASQPEPMEAVTVAVAKEVEHLRTTTSIGTVLALQSITLRNELPGTVRQVGLVPGEIVETGRVLVALDVSVEEADLQAQQAQASLAQTVLERVQRAGETGAVSRTEVDRALAERDVALAQIARTRAIIARKTIRAPFRSRVGIADLHTGQYLEEGTVLTTLQAVDEHANIDFTVAQQVAAGLHEGDPVEVLADGAASPITARIVAIDARVDPATRNAMVRARFRMSPGGPLPGASVRVQVPIGEPIQAISIPASALRRGPAGEQVFVIAPDDKGKMRARARQVESGPGLGDQVLIQKGLAAGEQVAAGGSFKLRESLLVAVVEDPASVSTTKN
ncbi:MAG TPA: efflux RND transporter periplasmic adaptor subunit [Candidatus Polarisedimenticolia bacterium]|nr:efflux RND transporter periplasmic adaptor subunit [Candidatus Polarisedimenticolia bacterium]